MTGSFANYQFSKLIIPQPTLQNLTILALFLVVATMTKQKKETAFLDMAQTAQLKGTAILLVVVDHLWYHVSEYKAFPLLGGYAVTLFLILSGFGLTLSFDNKPFVVKDFIIRRLSRVMIPYWIVTLLILFLDAYLLGRTYSASQIISTFAGMNFSADLKRLDYARWYITLLIIYICGFCYRS